MSFIFLLNFTANAFAISEDPILDVAEMQIEEVETNTKELLKITNETKEEALEIEETKENQIVESFNYRGRMYIDSPNNKAILIKGEDENFVISGWAVSDHRNAIVRLLVDEKVIGNCIRTDRGDVDYCISPEYGGVANTPKAGFEYCLDMSHLSIGSHKITVQELSESGTVIVESVVQVQIKEKQYRGRMYIDSPSNQAILTKGEEENFVISGWAVSDHRNATVRLLVDEKVIGNCIRTGRGDVDYCVSPEYGGVANTPKAGFEYCLDMSHLSIGSHKITVQELSESGTVIVESVVQVQIKEKQYRGRMYIDSPSNQTIFTKGEEENFVISGWAVSDHRNAIVRLLVDENVIGNCMRTDRGDVDYCVSPEYGGVANTPKAGFEYWLDMSHLSIGSHKIAVQELSESGTVIVESVIQVQIKEKQYQGRMYIDSPNNEAIFIKGEDENFAISGWAVSDARNATVRLLVDGNIMGNCIRTGRGDVDYCVSPEYGGVANTPKAGFEYWLDMSHLSIGSHKITVQELSESGTVIVESVVQVQIQGKKYQGRMYIDSPNNEAIFTKGEDEKFAISGWAVSNDREATVRLLVDGNVIGNCNRTGRGDVDFSVSPQYGGTDNTPNAGFESWINITQLSSGIHRIRVEEVSRYGDVICSSEIQIIQKNRQYRGTSYLETPTNQMQFIKQNQTTLKVQGWAVSEDRDAVVRILLDGIVVKEKCSRMERGDVDSIISPQYGGVNNTPRAGFCETLDIRHLMLGNHLLRVEEISRFGDLISANEVIIQEINQPYLGEMCLDNPLNGTVQIKGSNLTVAGWAVAQDESARVEIYIDGNFHTTADRYYRQDVTHYMNKYDGKTVNAGFGKLVNTSNMAVGTHTITVYEKSRYGDVIGGISRTFIVKSNAVVDNNSGNNQSNQGTSKPVVTQPSNPTTNVSGTKGIDVSQFQGSINWKSVANSNVKYALIRAGYRAYGTGKLVEDTRFKKNFSEAVANGLKVGVYLYSAAINSSEAKGDAEYVVSLLRKYGYQNSVSMPVVIDLELVSGVNTRDKNVSKATRTSIANTFCQTIAGYGYTPMVYACKSFLNDNMYANQVPYDIWVAQYHSKCTYSGPYTIWQYTSSGKVPGINGNVDCNICYKNY